VPFQFATGETDGVRLVSLDELLSTADFVSLHCPLTEQTRNLIGLRELALMKQSGTETTYAAKIDKAEARINWTMPAYSVLRHIHGLFPSAWCEMPISGQAIRVNILRCELAEGGGFPGELLDDRLTIACGQGAIRILELQKAGGTPMKANVFLAGARLQRPARLN